HRRTEARCIVRVQASVSRTAPFSDAFRLATPDRAPTVAALLMKLPAVLLAFAAAAFIARADEYAARTFSGPDGATLPYRLLTPKNYDPAQKYPLVIFLHGAGERGDDNQAQLRHGAPLFLKPEVRDKFPCFVFAPQCPKDQTWSPVKGWTEGASWT